MDADLVRPAATVAPGEELACTVGSVDNGHPCLVLNPAGGATVDNSEGGASAALTAFELCIAAKTHGRGGVGPVAVAAGGTASSALVAEASEVVVAVGWYVFADPTSTSTTVVGGMVAGASDSNHHDCSDNELHGNKK